MNTRAHELSMRAAASAERHRIKTILSFSMEGVESLCTLLAFETNYSVEQSALMVNRALRALRGVDQKAAAFVARVTEPNPLLAACPPDW